MPRKSKDEILKENIRKFTRFIYFGNKAAAERLLEDFKKDLLVKGERGKGAYDALSGMINAVAEDAKASFYFKVYNEMSPDEILQERQVMIAESVADMMEDYDKGFYEAWFIVLDAMAKIKKEAPPPLA